MTTLKCDGLWQRDSLYLWSDKEHNEECHSVYPGTSIDRHNNCIFLHVTVRDTNLHEVDQFSHPLHHSKSTYTCGQMCEVLRGDVSVAHAGHAGHTLLSLQHSHHCGLLLIWVSLDTGLCPLYCHTVLTLCSLLCPASNWAQSPVSLRHSPGTNRSGPGLYRHGGLRGQCVTQAMCCLQPQPGETNQNLMCVMCKWWCQIVREDGGTDTEAALAGAASPRAESGAE